MKNILVFGEVLWDIIGDTELIGGAPFNFSAQITRLGSNVTFVSRVGCDERGAASRESIKRLGINDQQVQSDVLHPTGTALVTVSSSGSPGYILPEHAAYDFIDFDETLQSVLFREYDAVYFGTLAQRNYISAKTLEKIFETVSARHFFYDINLRLTYYSKEVLNRSLNRATIVKMNDEEADLVSGMLYGSENTFEQLYSNLQKAYNTEVLCITKGKYGCEVFCKGGKASEPGIPVKVVDTIGAGDAFSAAFMNEYLLSGNISAAAKAGNIMGSKIASQKGAV